MILINCIWLQTMNCFGNNTQQNTVLKMTCFKFFFAGALLSKGAFIVYDAITNLPIGSSRYYEYNKAKKNQLQLVTPLLPEAVEQRDTT